MVIVSPVLCGLEVGEGSRVGFRNDARSSFSIETPRFGYGPYSSFGDIYKGELKIKTFTSLSQSKDGSTLCYVFFGLACWVFGY